MRQNLGLCPNVEKSKKQTIKLRQNLGWRSNNEKPNEQRIKWDRTQDGGFDAKAKEEMIKVRQNIGWCPMMRNERKKE